MKTPATILLAIPLAASIIHVPTQNLLQKAIDPNPGLHSYVAAASLAAELHAVVPLRKTFAGTDYYLRPNQKIVFDDVPGPLRRFRALASTVPTYQEVRADYTATPLSDDGTVSRYSLVPVKPDRRVSGLELTIDDRTALITRAVWSYTDGGRLSFDQKYVPVGAFRLPREETISARFPGYNVDGTLTFSDYRLDTAIPPAIFASAP
ncbi:MAG: hypothetical protein WCE44_11465 [Candidatus Velthaea sp.]|jgi:hypothetical protein